MLLNSVGNVVYPRFPYCSKNTWRSCITRKNKNEKTEMKEEERNKKNTQNKIEEKNKTNSVRTQPAKDDATRRCTHVKSTNRFDPNKKRVENTRTNDRMKNLKKREEWKILRTTEMHAYRHAYCMPMYDVLVRKTDDDCIPLRLIKKYTHASHTLAQQLALPCADACTESGKNDMCATHGRSQCDDIVYRNVCFFPFLYVLLWMDLIHTIDR